MVTVEALQTMMTNLQAQAHQNMVTLAQQHMDALKEIVHSNTRGGSSGMTDTRDIGRPVVFKGEEQRYGEWKAKLFAFLRVSTPQAMEWISWAGSQASTIDEELIAEDYRSENQEVINFGNRLYAILLSCTEEDPFNICYSVADGNGLEAMRLLMKRYEPRTPGTKRALLKAVINNLPSKRPDEIEKNMMHVEELMRKYEQLAGEGLPEDLRITVIIDLCTKDLRERLEHGTKDMSYKQVRDEIMAYVERKRDLFGSQVKAMEVDRFEQDEWETYAAEKDITWWGGDTVQRSWSDNHDVPGDVNPLHYKGSSKGHHFTKGNGKTFSSGNGGKGAKGKGKYSGIVNNKSGVKGTGGKGYSEKGSGKGAAQFNGTCHWCGEWGHSQSRCRWKDEYMEWVRRTRAEHTHNVEEEEEIEVESANLESLEVKRGEWRALCSLENRFAVLMNDDEEGHDDNEAPASESVVPQEDEDWVHVLNKKKTMKGESKKLRNRWTRFKDMEINGFETEELSAVKEEDGDSLWITVDSGASENVRSEAVERKSWWGKDVTAMNNKGEKDVKVRTKEGHKCVMKMQVTDVQKPLMSVSRICDAGHRVVFLRDGGYIEHEKTGQRTEFARVDNVYRLNVQCEKGFSRPGL